MGSKRYSAKELNAVFTEDRVRCNNGQLVPSGSRNDEPVTRIAVDCGKFGRRQAQV
jgi:hypothetical protein